MNSPKNCICHYGKYDHAGYCQLFGSSRCPYNTRDFRFGADGILRPGGQQDRTLRLEIEHLEGRIEYLEGLTEELKKKNAFLLLQNHSNREKDNEHQLTFLSLGEKSEDKERKKQLDAALDELAGMASLVERFKNRAARLKRALKVSEGMVAELRGRVRDLETRLAVPRADSTNSGVPPALDISNNRNRKGKEGENGCPESGSGRAQGGQPGHEPHFRAHFEKGEAEELPPIGFPEGQVITCCGVTAERDQTKDERKDHNTQPYQPSQKLTQRSLAYKCPKCGKIHYFRKPAGGYMGTLLDIGLTTEVLDLRYEHHLPTRHLRSFLKAKEVHVSNAHIVGACFAEPRRSGPLTSSSRMP